MDENFEIIWSALFETSSPELRRPFKPIFSFDESKIILALTMSDPVIIGVLNASNGSILNSY